MKRVIIGAVICAAFLAFGQSRAQAMIEFCPARLNIAPVKTDVAQKDDAPAALYGFDLEAMGPRSLTATLAFDTSGGWFKIDVPPVTLTERVRHYTSVSAYFTRTDFVSPVMYVRFPQAVTLSHTWVYTARTSDDGPFGWAKQGQVTCDPPGTAKATGPIGRFAARLDPKDLDALSDPPAQRSFIAAAQRTAPLETGTCSDPFADATATDIVSPDYPMALRGFSTRVLSSSIEVAIDAAGNVADAWVWGPSGAEAADAASLAAARATKYKAGRAYCRNVPGLYMFRVTFDPNR